jgi:AcrR family transcriptional regulator
MGTNVKENRVTKDSTSKQRQSGTGESPVRGRILEAAFAAFTKQGYVATSTAEIAARARVSKREIYALIGNKQEMLVACISERARRLQLPTDLPVPQDREGLAKVLTSFGAQLLREVSDPTVIAVFRLAIAEAIHAREVAQAVDSIGRETSRAALRKIMAQALDSGLIEGSPVECAEQFSGLLWENLMVSLLLGVAKRPGPQDIATRAEAAATAFLRLHPPPDAAPRGHRPRK